MYTKQTYTYKTVQDCRMQADVYQIPGPSSQPAILWIHGGALIYGDRTQLPLEQAEFYLAAGYTVVSIDYRLAPESKLDAILEDLQDAFAWIRNQGPALFHIDPNRIAVIGHSAGGYLTLMAGVCVHPRPQVLVSFYGYGDIAGAWYSQPDPFYNQQAAVLPENAYRGIGTTMTATSTGEAYKERGSFYLYCRQQGLWPKEVTGHDPHIDPHAFDSTCPVRQVTAAYPPTLLLHGDQDTDVPFEQSQLMDTALTQHHVLHKLLRMEGFGHAFDLLRNDVKPTELVGLQHPEVAKAFDAVLVFLSEQLN